MRNLSSFVVVMAMICLTGCSQQKKADSKAPVSVDVYSIDDMRGSESKDYVGTVEEKTGSTLSFEVAGNITSLRVDEGDYVSRGQVIASINPVSLKEAHRATLVTLKQAQDAYKRFLPLHKSGTISDMRWVDIESKLEQAQAAESIARQQLSHTTLTAPYSGVIASKEADMGAYVLPGQPIVKLADVAQVNVKISIPEAEISHIRVGDAITATVAALGGARFDGTVTEKGIDANPISHTYDVKARIANSHGKLLPGMVCNAKVYPNGKRQQSLGNSAHVVIPAESIELDVDNSRFVWTVINGKAHQQPIQVGDFEGDGVVVLSGLKPGDSVIVGGQQKVSEGMRVNTNKRR
ncbi:MAG TPA: efflux RND transporter periplasmic adaptor subunit [Prevotella sp.]|nr:efflux RND transporter periplasmic adaptor subunit [Candidatus Segatella violae]